MLRHASRALFRFSLVFGATLLVAPARAEDPAPSHSLEEWLAPIAQDRLFTVSTVGVQVVNVRTGEEVFARNADRGMVPASTMKTVTAATALKKLGPSYRFTTEILADEDEHIDGQGVLKGNLYVEGHGDPTIVIEKLWKMAYDLKLDGLKKVEGDLVYDENWLDTNYVIPGWNKSADLENGPTYFPALGALSLNNNTVALVVGPGAGVGKEARVELETPTPGYIEIDNRVVTTAAGSRRSVRINRELTEDDTLKFTLTGTCPSDGEAERYYRTVLDPTAYFMSAFGEMLKSQGIEIEGRTRRGDAPDDGELLVSLRSAPLAQVLADMNKASNNFIAEQVLRVVGAETQGLPGTTEKGLVAVRDYLGSIGVPADQYKTFNGSGLSRETSMAPSVFTAVLLDMAHDDRVGHEFASSLAIAGRDGTLWRRLSEDPGRLRGKTGTLDGVHCLVGYTEAADGELYAFSFLVNNIRGDSGPVRRLHDRFARRLFLAGQAGPEVVEGGGDDGGDDAEAAP